MARYTVTHACGHTSEVQLYGKEKDRQWRLHRLEQEDCLDCRNAAAAKANEAEGLPALRGSEKQVCWAESVRSRIVHELERSAEAYIESQTLLAQIDEQKGPLPDSTARLGGREVVCKGGPRAMDRFHERAGAVLEKVRSETSAAWWIDHRDGICFEALARTVELRPAVTAGEREAAAAAEIECTLRPPAPKTETVCEVRILEGRVICLAFPEKREDFRELVRFGHQFAWDNGAWRREIPAYLDIEEKAAELGAVILLAGIPVRVPNDAVREREGGLLPVVVIEKDLSNRMASTIRHNRARGSHDIDLMSNIVAELVEMGKSDGWIARHLGMQVDELLRLKQLTGLADLYRHREYSPAWETETP